MGVRWTTTEQQTFLVAKGDGFLEAQKKGQVADFLNVLNEQWFQNWPELENNELFRLEDPTKPRPPLTEAEKVLLREEIVERKKQLRSWMDRRSAAYYRTRSKFDVTVYNKILKQKAKGRAPQAIEVYQKRYREKNRDALMAARTAFSAANSGKLDKKTSMKIQREVAMKLWREETAEVHAEVAEEVARITLARQNDKQEEKDEDLTSVQRTPEGYSSAIKQLPVFLEGVLSAAAQATGWKFFVLVGGPNPDVDGTIYTDRYHYGPESIAGNDFEQAYGEFNEKVLKPWNNHLKTCFSVNASNTLGVVQTASPAAGTSGGNHSSPPQPSLSPMNVDSTLIDDPSLSPEKEGMESGGAPTNVPSSMSSQMEIETLVSRETTEDDGIMNSNSRPVIPQFHLLSNSQGSVDEQMDLASDGLTMDGGHPGVPGGPNESIQVALVRMGMVDPISFNQGSFDDRNIDPALRCRSMTLSPTESPTSTLSCGTLAHVPGVNNTPLPPPPSATPIPSWTPTPTVRWDHDTQFLPTPLPPTINPNILAAAQQVQGFDFQVAGAVVPHELALGSQQVIDGSPPHPATFTDTHEVQKTQAAKKAVKKGTAKKGATAMSANQQIDAGDPGTANPPRILQSSQPPHKGDITVSRSGRIVKPPIRPDDFMLQHASRAKEIVMERGNKENTT